jgi:hypothetical protein
MKTLLRIIAILAALHIGLALVAATAMTLQPNYPRLTRITAAIALIALAGGAGYALWALWNLRWRGAVLIGAGYALLLLSQILHLARGSAEFSAASAVAFGAVSAIVLSPSARRLYQRERAAQAEAAGS